MYLIIGFNNNMKKWFGINIMFVEFCLLIKNIYPWKTLTT